MRRDVVTQIIVEYPSGAKTSPPVWKPNGSLTRIWKKKSLWRFGLREVNGKKKYDLHFAEENGEIHIVD